MPASPHGEARSRTMDPALPSLAATLGYAFRDPSLLAVALTHRSAAFEMSSARRGRPASDNERLEFLGDAVLALTVSDVIWTRMPEATEGELTRVRAAVVNEANLARVASGIGLGDALKLGRGEDRSGGRAKPSLLANTLEAVFAAVYLDGGFEAARAVITTLLDPSIEEVRAQGTRDEKTLLQEIVQGRHGVTPRYEVISTAGPDHDRTYAVEMRAGEILRAQGVGRSKKSAEQDAARRALQNLDVAPPAPEAPPDEPPGVIPGSRGFLVSPCIRLVVNQR